MKDVSEKSVVILEDKTYVDADVYDKLEKERDELKKANDELRKSYNDLLTAHDKLTKKLEHTKYDLDLTTETVHRQKIAIRTIELIFGGKIL